MEIFFEFEEKSNVRNVKVTTSSDVGNWFMNNVQTLICNIT